MKTTKDKNGVIHFEYNVFDRIQLFILRKTVWKFRLWLKKSPWYKNWYCRFLWRLPLIRSIEPFRMNSFDEAAVYLNRDIRHEAIRKQLIEMREEMGEEEMLKMIKKKLRRKEYKKYLKAIKKWKEKGKW